MTSRIRKWLSTACVVALLALPIQAFADPADQLNEAEHKTLQKLSEQSGGTIQVKWDETRGTPTFIAGKLSKPLRGQPYDMALTFLDSAKALYHVDRVKKSFRLKRVEHDQFGMKHVRLTHLAKGIPVWGDELTVNIDKNNVVRSIKGLFTPDIEQNTERIDKPSIQVQQAVKSALDDLKIAKPANTPTAMLYYFPYPNPETVTLTYVVGVRDESQQADWKVFVDAINGDVVHKYNEFKSKRSHGDVKKLAPLRHS